MTTMHRRRQYREKHAYQPTSLADLHMSNRYIAVLCALAGTGTALVVLVWLIGQPFFNLIFGA